VLRDPEELVGVVVEVLAQPFLEDWLGEGVGFALSDKSRRQAQARPMLLDFDHDLGEQPLRLDRVLGLKRSQLLALADARLQVRGNAAAKPVDPGLGMLPRAGHQQGHL
jgi:hypothetical protein